MTDSQLYGKLWKQVDGQGWKVYKVGPIERGHRASLGEWIPVFLIKVTADIPGYFDNPVEIHLKWRRESDSEGKWNTRVWVTGGEHRRLSDLEKLAFLGGRDGE